MIDDLIKALESKGLNDARSVVKELESCGALTDFDACKYMATQTVILNVSKDTLSTTRIISDVAYIYNISRKTLERTLGV